CSRLGEYDVEGEVVGFGAAGGEDQLARPGSEPCGDAGPRRFEGWTDGLPEAVGAGGGGPQSAAAFVHGRRHLVGGAGGGVVSQVDPLHLRIVGGLRGRLPAEAVGRPVAAALLMRWIAARAPDGTSRVSALQSPACQDQRFARILWTF